MALPNRPEWLAAELLLAVTLREHLWDKFPAEAQGHVSKLLGAALALVMLRILWELAPSSRWLGAVLALAVWYQLQTLLCVWWWLIDGPWQLLPGTGMCSARLDFDLGAAGLMLTSLILCKLAPMIFRDSDNDKDARQ